MTDRLDVIEWGLAWQGVLENSVPMSWNLFLALLPLALSCELFHRPRSPIVYGGIWLLVVITLAPFMGVAINRFGGIPVLGVGATILLLILVSQFKFPGKALMQPLVWWIGCLMFVLFLPNAAYVLTDLIHFVHDARKDYAMGTLILVLLPQYVLFLVTGFQSYVAALMNVGYFLTERGRSQWIPWIELVTHALVAIAVYLGRFLRFNSWDVFMMPGELIKTIIHIFVSAHNMVILLIFFGMYTFCYWLCKRITIGLLAQKDAFPTTVS